MDSSSRPERTTTATTVSTITSLARTSRTAGRPVTDTHHESCWCGQDMDVVRGGHCPRCGTMRARRAQAAPPSLPRLAA